jgi:hypothetical protein
LLITDPNDTEAYFTQLINARKNYIDNDSTLEILTNNNNTKVNSYATLSESSIAISTLNFSNQPLEVTVELTNLQEQIAAYTVFVDVFGTGKSTVSDDFSTLTASLEPYEASVIIFTDEMVDSTSSEGRTTDSPGAIGAAQAKNLLQNGDFSSGFSAWNSFVHSDGGGEAEFAPSDGALQVSISQRGTEIWHIQLVQSQIELINGETYVVAFTASAAEPQSINVALQHDGGDFATYGSKTFTISTEPTSYQFSFTMVAETDSVARFVIELGTSEGRVTFDDFVLRISD